MNLDLTNKTALICGASQGLGLACATELALLGASIVAVSRSDDKLRAVVKKLDTSKGQKHSFMVLDLAEPELVQQAIQSFLTKNPVVHILVNNAGGPPSGPMIDTD